MKNLIMISLLTIMITSSYAAVNEQYTCEKWQVLDMTFTLKGHIDHPLDVTFGATIIHENTNDSRDVPHSTSLRKINGFYNGDDTWVIRFTPPAEGKWTYTTWSSVPKLSGLTGTVSVSPNTNPEEHGAVVVSKENPQKFTLEDGTPYFLMAYEMDWLFAPDAKQDMEDPDSAELPKTRKIISAIAENHFNQVVMNVYAFDADWGERDKIAPEYNFARPEVFPFGGTNQTPDYSTLNIDFFKHLDHILAYLNEKHIVAHLMIYVWNKHVNWPEPESAADNLYFDYVVNRYQAFPNLIWDISKEALSYNHNDMGYITRRIDRLRSLDAYHRLVTVHDYAYCSAFPGKVDFISVQDWQPGIYSGMRKIVEKHPGLPVLNIEHGGYEKTMHSIFDGAYTDPVICLDRNYKCIFAGTYSTYYWQNSSWYELVWDPFSLDKKTQPHFDFYRHLAGLFTRYDYNTLVPDKQFSAGYCLTDHKSTYLFYLPEGMISLQGNFPELKGKNVSVTWFDPLTGIYFDDPDIKTNTGEWLGIHRNENITGPMAVVILKVTTD